MAPIAAAAAAATFGTPPSIGQGGRSTSAFMELQDDAMLSPQPALDQAGLPPGSTSTEALAAVLSRLVMSTAVHTPEATPGGGRSPANAYNTKSTLISKGCRLEQTTGGSRLVGDTPTTVASPGTASPITASDEEVGADSASLSCSQQQEQLTAAPETALHDCATTPELIDFLLTALCGKTPLPEQQQQEQSQQPPQPSAADGTNFDAWVADCLQNNDPSAASSSSSSSAERHVQPTEFDSSTQLLQPPSLAIPDNFDPFGQLLKTLTGVDSDTPGTDASQWLLENLCAMAAAQPASPPPSMSNDSESTHHDHQRLLPGQQDSSPMDSRKSVAAASNDSVSDRILASLNAIARTSRSATMANSAAQEKTGLGSVRIRNLFLDETNNSHAPASSYLDLSLFKGFKCQAEDSNTRIISSSVAAALSAAAEKDHTTSADAAADHMREALAVAAGAASPPHDRKNCPFYHSNRDRRRLPVFYNAEQCEAHFDFDSEGSTCCCARGDNCERCHNRHELLYHPKIYKQRFCSSYKTAGSPAAQCHRGRFCAFAHSREEIRCSLFTEDEELFPTAEFFMRRFKTFWCPYGVQHDWHGCLYAHTYQDCRRSPDIEYGSEPCPYWQKDLHSADYHRRCPLGAQCPYAHGSKEQLYHPAYYKTMPCADYKLRRDCPRGTFCAFYHELSERRRTADDKTEAADNENSANAVVVAASYDYTRPVPADKIIFLQHNFMAPPLFNLDDFEAFGHYSRGCSGESPSAAASGTNSLSMLPRQRRLASNQRARYNGRTTSNSSSYNSRPAAFSNSHHTDDQNEEFYANRLTPNGFFHKDRLMQLNAPSPAAAERLRNCRGMSGSTSGAAASWQLGPRHNGNNLAYPATGLGYRGSNLSNVPTAGSGERHYSGFPPPSRRLQSLSAAAAAAENDGFRLTNNNNNNRSNSRSARPPTTNNAHRRNRKKI